MPKWLIFEISKIKPEGLIIEEKRFKGDKLLITELFIPTFQVKKFFNEAGSKKTREERALTIINKVLKEIKYPLDWRKNPTDYHYFQAFKKNPFKCIIEKVNKYDYWSTCHETVVKGYGDCEDSSILMHTGFLLHEITPSFFVLGRVYKGYLHRLRFLGYHAWVISYIDTYRLIETTLESEVKNVNFFPKVDIGNNVWEWKTIAGTLVYEGLFMIKNLEEIWISRKLSISTFINRYMEIFKEVSTTTLALHFNPESIDDLEKYFTENYALKTLLKMYTKDKKREREKLKTIKEIVSFTFEH